MRYLLLSDLHSNLEATLAVVDSARSEGFDQALVLGDLVGYGACPNEVVNVVRDLAPRAVIRGNHDKVVSGIDTGEDFNLVALQAALFNRKVLSRENRDYLSTLPRGPMSVGDRTLLAHGTPLDEDDYLVDRSDAERIFEESDFQVCFFGHTHIAGAFRSEAGKVSGLVPSKRISLLPLHPAGRYLVNPGSVGQPRDGDPRASFAIYDDGTRQVWIHRVEYSIRDAQERILAAGLPPGLAERLRRGI